MKTRFSPLVKIKKDMMDRCERQLQQANFNLDNAQIALEKAYRDLAEAKTPDSGAMQGFLQSRMIISAQRDIVAEKQEWFAFAEGEVEAAKKALKDAMMDYEKFKYLEAEEIKVMLVKEKRAQQIELDEIAVQNFGKRREA
ncbi:MAG: flagellar export protein FliJ [Sulfurimonadaceae bacterium]|nr:flagellar export protein FliJ [Sulfurimonadaceae bacterium]